MNSFKKYLSILLATAMFVGTVGIVARSSHGGGGHRGSGHHGGGHYGGRGWGGGGWGYGVGLGWGGYYGGWPYYGYGWGYPGYYTKPSYAKDNSGESFWMIYNQSRIPLRVQSDRDETVIPAGAIKKLYRKNSFNIRVYTRGLIRTINTRQHAVAVDLDEVGKPYFNL